MLQVLQGSNKAVYHPMTDCGDHVVVINSKHIALLGREWQYRVYYHHTGYPRAFKHMGRHNGKLWIPAWQLHDRDPTLVLWKAVYNNMENNLMRRNNIARLHIFPEEEVGNSLIQPNTKIAKVEHFVAGARRHYEQCDRPNTTIETGAQNISRLFRRRKRKVSTCVQC